MKHDRGLVAAEVEAVEADDSGEGLPDHVRVTRGHGRSRTLQVRLNEDELVALQERAAAAGVPVSTLVRSVLLEWMQPTERADLQVVARRLRDLSDQLSEAVY